MKICLKKGEVSGWKLQIWEFLGKNENSAWSSGA